MERNVAMHQPSARIVRLKCEHEVALCRKSGGVASDRIIGFEPRDVSGPLGARLLIEDVKVMAMEVDWMREGRGGCILLNDPVLPLSHAKSVRHSTMYRVASFTHLILLTDLEHIPLGGESVISIDNVLQCRILEIDQHRTSIDKPLHQIATARRIGEPDLHLLGQTLRYRSLDIRRDLFVIAACWQRCCSSRVGIA
jgi:hypothetical protein